MNTEEIRDLAKIFRDAILRVPPHQLAIGMQGFPRGACGDTSLLLGALLRDMGEPGFWYMSASRGNAMDESWTSHAWLQREELIVDLTADQFADAPQGFIAEEKSVWHRTFHVDRWSGPDFREWAGAGNLGPSYRLIRKAMLPG